MPWFHPYNVYGACQKLLESYHCNQSWRYKRPLLVFERRKNSKHPGIQRFFKNPILDWNSWEHLGLMMILSCGNQKYLHWMRQSFKTCPPACNWLPNWVRTNLWCCPLCCPLLPLPKPIWNYFHCCCEPQFGEIYNIDSTLRSLHVDMPVTIDCLCASGNIQWGQLFLTAIMPTV